MAETDPNLGLNYGWEYRESGWKPGMDANLQKLGAVVQLSVLAIADDPPETPDPGDRYIVGTGTGAWAGKDGQVAIYIAAAWTFYPPGSGWLAWVEDALAPGLYVYHAASWQLLLALPA